MAQLNSTHDPALRSWVPSANLPQVDFPIQNLPFGIFTRAHSGEALRAGVAIGDQIVDLAALHGRRVLKGTAGQALAACTGPALNPFMALGGDAWSVLRHALCGLLREGAPGAASLHDSLVPQCDAQLAVPALIGDFTDFYASINHASAVGRLFRPDNPLLPNYKWVPIAYHGRASSIRVSGQRFHRPMGQICAADATSPELQPTRRLDYELEVGMFVGTGNELGRPIPIAEAEQHVFGLCLLNDWSARDIQAWEYQPLGPFLAKNFATTISPWIVTLEALAPYRVPWSRPPTDPAPLPYLDDQRLRLEGAIELQLEAAIETANMRKTGMAPHVLSCSSFRHCYWTVSQLIAHHTINGCNLLPGDLFGSGTQSGPASEQAGSLLELTSGGKRQLQLASGEMRTFVADGDRIILRGWCAKPGRVRIGFGEAAATVLPAGAPAAAPDQNAK
ncbi:MAG TPA: fumarylacetoacetase [Steroidobacteraceae bacterium]